MLTAPRAGRHPPLRPWLPWVSLPLAFAAFAIDVRWGLAPIPQFLYFFPPLLAFWSASQRYPFLVGAQVTALSVSAMVLRGDFTVTLVADRALDLAAVWITVVLCVVHHRYRLALLKAEASLLGEAALTRLGEVALMVAHEVKNPLAGIRGAIQVMGDRLPDDPKLQRFAERALLSIDGLTKLVDDLLVFARPGLPARAAVRVLPLVRDVAALVEKDPRVGTGHVTVRGEDPEINGDASLLRQAVLNLLVNAAEAGGPDKEIDVLVRCVGAGGCIEVHDSGPGIPTELRTKIFEPFYSTKARGSGLGLAIAKRVVVLHGGDIQVKCPAQGGTTMIVSLP